MKIYENFLYFIQLPLFYIKEREFDAQITDYIQNEYI